MLTPSTRILARVVQLAQVFQPANGGRGRTRAIVIQNLDIQEFGERRDAGRTDAKSVNLGVSPSSSR